MASRLKRWSLATGIAVAGILAVTIPPGPSTLSFVFYRFFEEAEPTGIDGHLQAVNSAFNRAEWNLRAARVRTTLGAVGPQGASPIVLQVAEGGTTTAIDADLTSQVAKLWRVHEIPSGEVRTVLVTGAPVGLVEEAIPPTPGVCFARLVDKFEARRRANRVGSSAGLCALVSRFGAPGDSVHRWVVGVGHIMVPEVAPRMGPGIRGIEAGFQWPDVVFGEYRVYESRVPWWVGRAALACGKGRAEFCREAVGLGERPPERLGNGRYSLAYPSELPAALLTELGPERFGELWRSDAPIPESFERLTGTPFDPWAMQFVQRRIGRVERPTALGPGGGLGWLFWMGLLTGWTIVRLRSSRAR